MAKTEPKTRTYEVQASLKLLVTKTISALSLDEALNQAKALKEKDFIKFSGEYLDGEFKITGLYESNP